MREREGLMRKLGKVCPHLTAAPLPDHAALPDPFAHAALYAHLSTCPPPQKKKHTHTHTHSHTHPYSSSSCY